MERLSFLLNQLQAYPTLDQLRRSEFFAECGAEIESVLERPDVFHNPEAAPRLRRFLRVVQWNIEKGKRHAAVIHTLQSSEVLRHADLLLLNEADWGMCRSGNLHIARSMALELGMNMVFGPVHLELTKGTADDLESPGENRESLQGNAVLSRYPILEARIVPLPVCFEPFEFHEKRYGRRNCVWARIHAGGQTLWVWATHLEVRNTQACRARQMKYLLDNLPGGSHEPHLLGGDFNTNGFPRGTLWRTIASVGRLVRTAPERLKEQLCHPERSFEPLFHVVRKAGFTWEGLNSFEATASVPIGGLEDSRFIPKFLDDWITRRLSPHAGYLHFKLDWLLSRGVRTLRRGDFLDHEAGVASLDPGCVALQQCGPDRISDHIPIYADLRIQDTSRT